MENAVDRRLRDVAERLAAAYVEHVRPRAILLTGSAAAGGADPFSDIDMVVYADLQPTKQQLDAVVAAVGGAYPDGRKLWVDGIECDGGVTTIAETEQLIDDVLVRFVAKSPGQKVLEGVTGGVALHGADLIEGWQVRARVYPPELARAMVDAYLTFWPIWRVANWVAARDMTLWYHHSLVESAENILGVLAGLNALYYSPAYFKRLRRFAAQMTVAPDALPDRLEALFTAAPSIAVLELERLVADTVALVEFNLPDVDTSRVRRDLGSRRPIGESNR
jgi:hypothetical protein